jgi:hypothetical protein
MTENVGGLKNVAVPPILDFLRSDGSLYAEIKGDATKTASSFLKKNGKILGKCQGS